MPVSKKRKKAGKPVQRSKPVVAEAGGPPIPEGTVAAPTKVGRPSNPFVAFQQARRASQRGR
jgi:hypothetical protein